MISIKLDGLEGLQTAISKTLKEAEAGTKKAIGTFVKAVETEAKKLAPANEGVLRNSIVGDIKNFVGTSNSTVVGTITVRANYAAYLEFGTRKFAARYVATLPADWKAYAATFKGKGGGTMAQFIQDIMQWVQQKGIGGLQTKSGNVSTSRSSQDLQQQAAYAIALNILQNGIKPHPFLYPAVVKHTPKLITDMKAVFNA